MKANQPKRKVFNDAIDLLTGDAPESGVQMIPIDKIVPFHEHPFKLYQGERLDDMVDSIKEHGILSPVIVLKTANGYEMLAGHNRQNAAKIAGLTEVPAIVKEGLTEEEAWVYVVETNVIQRSFNDLCITERIAVLSTRYDKVCGTKKREEILEELHLLNGDGGHHVHRQAKSRELIGQEYGMTGRHIARYIRCNQLIPAFKEMLDEGSLTMVAGVEISFLSHEEQALVFSVMEKNCIKLKKDMAGKLRTQQVLSRKRLYRRYLDLISLLQRSGDQSASSFRQRSITGILPIQLQRMCRAYWKKPLICILRGRGRRLCIHSRNWQQSTGATLQSLLPMNTT